jgi:alkylated DNA repair dioxygenase AlkB
MSQPDAKPEKKTSGKSERKNSPLNKLNAPASRQSPRTVSPLALHGNKTASPHGKKVESPLASPILSPGDTISPTVFPGTKKEAGSGDSLIAKKGKRSTCPCSGSSDGRDWVLQCSECRQCWHASCANLKGSGSLGQSSIDSILEHWLCPWCYSCPFTRPKSHPAYKNEDALADRTVTCTAIQQISEAVTEMISEKLPNSLPSQLSDNNSLLVSIRKDLDKLSSDIQSFAGQRTAQPEQSPRDCPSKPIKSVIPEEEGHESLEFVPYTNYAENFINEEYGKELLHFFEEQNFIKEGSRNVLFYGEKYKYMGSDKSPQPIPPILHRLTNKIKENLDVQYELNQILVNRYDKSSSLPFHSDNEVVINPNSSIFTLSLGAPGSIYFKELKENKEEKLIVENRSLYVMTRESQNHIGHQVAQNTSDEVRYSITLRAVHWQNFNSTYAVGDSNFGKIKFGEGRGKIGASTPGCKDWAPCIKDLKPRKGSSYRNIVIMVGTNDLKADGVDVLETYKLYKGKIEMFREYNMKGNIFICPVLPSRDRKINRNINEFNRYLFDDLLQTNLRVNLVQGFRDFADRDGMLRSSLHDPRTPNDVLHINDRGYCVLVRLIKLALFSIKRGKGKLTTGRSYANATRGGPPNPI